MAATFLMSVANHPGVSSIRLLFAGSLLVSVSLSVGFLTPYLSAVACASGIANLLFGPNSGDLIFVFSIIDAVALALLGPGAYSVDARLFGRRVTVISPGKKAVTTRKVD